MPKRKLHPVLQMSKARKQAWLDHAEPEDFFEMLTLLAQLYAKKSYVPKEGYRASGLLADYPEYLKGKVRDHQFTNNVPFLSSSDAPGSYVEEVKSEEDTTLEELMDLI